jgi:S-adenosylmethionine synthetase
MIVVAGEVTTTAIVDIPQVVRDTVREIGYTDPKTGLDVNNSTILVCLEKQSPDIARGVNRGDLKKQGAGDQGLMFGFACNETPALMPLPIHLAHLIVERLAKVRQSGALPWLRPDGKSQVTVEYVDGKPVRVDTVVCSTQYSDAPEYLKRGWIDKQGCMTQKGKQVIIDQVIKPVLPKKYLKGELTYHINPTGRFVVGGPHGDCGLTGRKIIVDTYGGRGCHGGGAFSGKDPSKVDRSASYMARHIAKNIVAAGLADICEVQIAYAIGVPDPVSILVDTQGTARVSEKKMHELVRKHFPLRPGEIVNYLKLLRPIYKETARHGHFGRNLPDFTWEKTNKAKALRADAGLK